MAEQRITQQRTRGRLGRLWHNVLLFCAALEMSDSEYLAWRMTLLAEAGRRDGADPEA